MKRNWQNFFGIVSFVLLFWTPADAGQVTRMALMGDAGRAGSSLNLLKQSLLKEQIFSVVMPGDNLYSGTYAQVWDSWKEAGFQFDVVAIGNHNSSYKEEMSYFSMPGEYHVVERPGARFLVLNSDNVQNVPEQMTWLEGQIETPWDGLTFLVYHHPTFTISPDHTWGERKKFQSALRGFFKKHAAKIHGIILGHDHISSFLHFGSIPVIVAGGGREVRSADPVSYQQDGFIVETAYLAPRKAHWALMEIIEDTREALVHFVNVSTQERPCTARIGLAGMSLEGQCLDKK